MLKKKKIKIRACLALIMKKGKPDRLGIVKSIIMGHTIKMNRFVSLEVEKAECGHTVPLEFIQYDEDGCGTCANCVIEELEFQLKKRKKARRLNSLVRTAPKKKNV